MRLEMRERQSGRALDDAGRVPGKHVRSARVHQQRCRQHDRGDPWLDDELAAQLLGDQTDFHGRRGHAAMHLRQRQREPAELGKLWP